MINKLSSGTKAAKFEKAMRTRMVGGSVEIRVKEVKMMTDFRFLAIQFLRAKTLREICNLTNRNYKGYTPDERECIKMLAKVLTREIIAKRKADRERGENV